MQVNIRREVERGKEKGVPNEGTKDGGNRQATPGWRRSGLVRSNYQVYGNGAAVTGFNSGQTDGPNW